SDLVPGRVHQRRAAADDAGGEDAARGEGVNGRPAVVSDRVRPRHGGAGDQPARRQRASGPGENSRAGDSAAAGVDPGWLVVGWLVVGGWWLVVGVAGRGPGIRDRGSRAKTKKETQTKS